MSQQWPQLKKNVVQNPAEREFPMQFWEKEDKVSGHRKRQGTKALFRRDDVTKELRMDTDIFKTTVDMQDFSFL